MTSPTAAMSPPTGSMSIPSAKQQFLDALRKEHETTLKVIRAFPAAQASFRPHPDSNSAQQLVWTFVVEEAMILAALTNALDMSKGFPKAPESWAETVAAFEAGHRATVAKLDSMRDDDLVGTVHFPTGPKRMGDVPKVEFLWFVLCDQIHHRGQLSVYLRMAGGRVPSIYGPSKDEPWF